MIYAKYYKPCENCGKNYLQQRKGTKYCKNCRTRMTNHVIPRPDTLPIRRWKRKEPGSPIQRVLAHLAAQQEDAP
jgi:hypothetical protein